MATSRELAGTVAAATDLREALLALGRFVAEVDVRTLPSEVGDALDLVLLDTLGVMTAGAATVEVQALATTVTSAGPARPRGLQRRYSAQDCALLDGTSVCVLELDEGNKHARGHPAAHVLPVVLALAAERDVTAGEAVAAFAAGHEVAARFGRAVRLRPGFHPHGNWGVAGAAAAAARLLGCDADGIAGAIDAAGGLALATPFTAALDGTFVRNLWTGLAATSGLQAARLARAGLTEPAGTAGAVFGELLGSFDVDALTVELGSRFDVALGYLKRHASCSYTHPPIDAVLELRDLHEFDPRDVEVIEVHTHRLAAPLDRPEPATRLAAMFSIPHLVAAALLRGHVDAAATGAEARADDAHRALAARVRVHHDPAMDEAPGRPAAVRILLADGTSHDTRVPDPIGDADHHPLDRAAVRDKLTTLLGTEATTAIERGVADLRAQPDRAAVEVLDAMP